MRTDNGLEYLSKEFDLFCKEKGVRRHRTVPANPQQNGVAERMNRTLLERVRCLLSSSGVSKQFWAEAVCTAGHLINKCPASGIGGAIPDERWYGGKSDYIRLRPFGCKAIAHQKQGKLSARALQCIMLGYQKGVKGYRLWCMEPGNQKILVSRDVIFIEDKMHFLSKEGKGANSAESEKNDAHFEVEKEQITGGVDEDSDDDFGGDQSEIIDLTDDGYDQPKDSEPSHNLDNYQLARDRKRRTEMLFYALHIAEQIEYSEPSTYAEAIASPEAEHWIKAMKEEIESLLKKKTWVLVDKA